MQKYLPCLHPNPGWGEQDAQELDCTIEPSSSSLVGKHCILELYDCDELKLDDESYLRTSLTNAAKLAGATLLNLITHRFHPHGITGLALLAESHISIHTWPENAYAAVDVFTCGNHTMPERACEILRQELSAKSFSFRSFNRAIPEGSKRTDRKA